MRMLGRPRNIVQPKPDGNADGADVKQIAAEYFGGSQLAVRKRVERKTIPFRRIGGRIVFSRRELSEWWAALEGCSVSEAVANARRGGSE
jgi:excisionase family DNA binding protein